MLYFLFSMILTMIILFLFMLASKKDSWNYGSSISFECGFTSYYYSRFSFSMHYFLVGLIFLFLDLELCFIMPFLNEDMSNLTLIFLCWMFVMILILGVLLEWAQGKLNWLY